MGGGNRNMRCDEMNVCVKNYAMPFSCAFDCFRGLYACIEVQSAVPCSTQTQCLRLGDVKSTLETCA